jgi:signal transduction histidine kinase
VLTRCCHAITRRRNNPARLFACSQRWLGTYPVIVNPPRVLGQAVWWAVAVDVMLAVLLAAVAWPFSGLRPAGPAQLASLILVLLAVVLRRAWPWVAWSLGLAGGLIQVAEGLTGFVALLGLVLVLYSVTAYGPRPMPLLTGVILPLAAVAGTITLVLRGTAPRLVAEALLPGSLPGGTISRAALLYAVVLTPLAATYLGGLARRSVLAAQQAAVRESLAAADSERAAQLATMQGQRAELAREVHDVVGHSLAVIIAQADSVRFRDLDAADAPEQVQATVAAIAATARDSLGEIREVLTRLGSAGDAPAGPAAGDAPPGPPAGDTLPELFARVRQAGVALTVRHEGEPSDAGPDERAVLVAVTREMLTNALRHGDRAAPVDVLLRWSPGGVLIQVRNRVGTGDGPGSAQPAGPAGPAGAGAGLGIPGMRARLSRVGGRLGTDREPRPDGGQDFVADAWVPGRTG